jgi:hypothetical protein
LDFEEVVAKLSDVNDKRRVGTTALRITRTLRQGVKPPAATLKRKALERAVRVVFAQPTVG